MKLKITAVGLLALVLLVGCANQADIDSWEGSSKDALILAYGAPEKTVKLDDGSELMEFHHERLSEGTSLYCTLRFIISPTGEVVRGKADGNIGGCNRLIKEKEGQ